MKSSTFILDSFDGTKIFTYKWAPDKNVKAVVQISHGMAETAVRYERFAKKLTEEGYIVYANDHRGHGKTAGNVENVGYLGIDGFNGMLYDMKKLNDLIHNENKEMKVFLLGHSMGSLLSQGYIAKYGDSIDGVILSGTSGRQGFMLDAGIFLAKIEMKRIGPKAPSKLLNDLTFGGYNKAFKPYKTDFDWLSRDEAEVKKYVDDDYCGGIFSSQFFYDFLRGVKESQNKSNIEKIPKNLPIYIFSGEKDPVGKNLKTIYPLIEEYKALKIEDISFKFYKEGRHEMLNETNKDEVMGDIIKWLNNHLK